MQNHYNLIYREEEREMIPLCLNEGVGLVPWSPLARGLLARPRPETARIVDAGTARATSDRYTEHLYDSPDDWNVVDAVETLAKSARRVDGGSRARVAPRTAGSRGADRRRDEAGASRHGAEVLEP